MAAISNQRTSPKTAPAFRVSQTSFQDYFEFWNGQYKGCTSLKEYMPMKLIKRGIKMWCRADSTHGYLCDFDIYTGKTQQGVQHGLGYSVVTKLCETIGDWYAIFCDNFFTSYKLIEYLYQNKK